MNKSLTFAILLLFSGNLSAQTSVFSDDFESGSTSWTISGNISPNLWIFNSCAGNGTTLTGATSMYISSGGIVPGCGATGTEQYAYVDAPAGINQIVSSTNVDAGCLSSLTASFDYRIDGVLTEDFAELVYSTDGGTSWIPVGSAFSISPAWTSVAVALPPALNAIAFDIGFRFTYNDNTINGAPIAIDNFDVSGIDVTNPAITCPVTQSDYLDGTCSLLLADYTGLAMTSDNCLSYGPVVVTQAPPVGSTIGSNATITLTGTDAFGNTASCVFTIQAIDTISPTISCPADFTVGTTLGCSNLLAAYSGLTSASDNCTFAGSLIYTQSPPAATVLPTGTNPIIITVNDGNGNSNSCSFSLTVEDQQAPLISLCSPNQNVIVDAGCQGTLGDYSGALTIIDNCSSLANLTYTQSPIPGTIISGNTMVTITVEDENSNSSNCVFTAILSDTTSPIVTCPANITSPINGSCQYLIPDLSASVTGTDNCSVLANMGIYQNPVAGATANGITPILVTLSDEQGNISTCITTVLPDDQIVPTITCPGPLTADIGANCDFLLPNYSGISLVLDNCSDFSIAQSPPPGTLTSLGTNNIELTVTDAGGNTANCAFILNVIESQTPTIICPSNISTCDPVVTYANPSFSDNCIASISQTDLTGFTSGSNFPVGITVLEYTVTDGSGNSTQCTFNVQILDYPSPAIISEDTISLCDQNSLVLDADPLVSGSGLWTVSTGQGSFNNQFANSTGINNISIGTNIYVWTVSSPTCGTLVDSIFVINSQQDLPASTQDIIYACADLNVVLQSNIPLYGIGTWTTDGNGVISDINSANTTSILVDNGWQNFIWTITSGSCLASSDTLAVFSMQKPVINESDTAVCLENDLLVFSATSPSLDQTSLWSTPNATIVISDINLSNTSVSNFGIGTNTIIYTLMNSNCGEFTDTVTVIGSLCNGFQPIIPTVITPGNLDGKNDVLTIDFLNVMYPECHVVIFNRWGSVVYESVGYNEPWNGQFKGESLPMGTYFYKIELNDPDETLLKGDISIIN